MILEKLGIQVQGVYKSYKKALPLIKNNLPDFMIVDLFLDNNEKGLDFIREMRDFFIPTIICSGYPEQSYMDMALEADVFAFITKPIDKATLTYQIKRMVKEIKSNNFKTNHLLVKEKRVMIKIPFHKISKIEIDGNYSYIFLASGKKYVLKISLKKLKEMLDPSKFLRCHRSTIVNLDFVDSLNLHESSLKLNNDIQIQIGAKYKGSIKKSFTSK